MAARMRWAQNANEQRGAPGVCHGGRAARGGGPETWKRVTRKGEAPNVALRADIGGGGLDRGGVAVISGPSRRRQESRSYGRAGGRVRYVFAHAFEGGDAGDGDPGFGDFRVECSHKPIEREIQ
jgi:hypothetical protein